MRRTLDLALILAHLLVCFLPRVVAASEPAYGAEAMVVSPEPYATDVGVRILRAGGNAFDAAAAVGFALAVTYPTAGNLGGGGFAVALKADGTTLALDFREKAPLAATRDMYLGEQKKVIAGLSLSSHLAVGVPGTVEGLLRLAESEGALARDRILGPAIALAAEGFIVSESFSRSIAGSRGKLTKYPASAAIFFSQGKPPVPGDRLKQPDLARTLEAIARSGRDGFYGGRVAELIVAEMDRHGGLITRKDLRAYRSKSREPLIFQSGPYELISMPLPSSGGVTLAQILGLLDLENLSALGRQSARYIHRLTEAERLAFADRNYFLGDSDFVEVPVDRLISDSYLAERAKLMPRGRAGRSKGVDHGSAESEQTTHYCVADRWGNVVAVTYTLNAGYGMGAVVEGAGFLLNNEMDDFSAKPGEPNLYGLTGAEANAIEPGKRMLSSMTPTIVRREGEFFMTMGSPGGPTIITTVLQIFLNATLFDMNIAEAIDAGRVHHQWLPDRVQYEAGALEPEVRAELARMGYTLSERRSIGMATGIQRTKDGRLAGHADRRGSGKAAGY